LCGYEPGGHRIRGVPGGHRLHSSSQSGSFNDFYYGSTEYHLNEFSTDLNDFYYGSV